MAEINTNLDTTPLPPNNLVAKDPESAELAGYVRTKTFGRDVRESIARSIELNSTRSKSAEILANKTLAVTNRIKEDTETATAEMANQVELIRAEKDAVIANATVDSEVILARGGKTTLGQRLDETDAQLADIVQDESITVTVGDGGDYATVNNAIGYLSRKKLKYSNAGLKAEIKLLSGFVMAEQVYVKNIDLSYISITSEDAEVLVDATGFINNVNEMGYAGGGIAIESGALFTGYGNATLPFIDVLFDMNNSGATGRAHGIFLIYGATARIGRMKGFKNSRGNGIYVTEGSKLYATEAISTYSNGNNISCFRGSYILFRGGNATYASGNGAYLDNSCTMDAAHADFSNANGIGVWVSVTSTASIPFAHVDDCGNHGVQADNGSTIDLHGGTVKNSGQRGISCASARVVAKDCNILNSATDSVFCTDSGIVDILNSIVTGGGNNGIHALYGGIINASGANAQKVLDTDGADIRVTNGGIIFANGAIGGTRGVTPNTVASAGIIIRNNVPRGFTGATEGRCVWSTELGGRTSSSILPLDYADEKTITINTCSIYFGTNLSAEEVASITIDKTPFGISLKAGDAVATKLSGTNTKVTFTVA